MKRILYIAPHSFPIKSSEAICNSKVAYMLAESGYVVDVFSCDDSSTYPTDVDYNKRLSSSKNINIYSVKPRYILLKKDKLYRIFLNIIYNLSIFLITGYFYNGISIPYLIYKRVCKHIKDNNIRYDAVITRGFSTDLVGILMSKRFCVKWIANWNDPFPLQRFPAPYGQGYKAKLPYFQEKVIRDIQKYATLHTFPNNRLRDYMLKCFPFINLEQTMIIPHMALSSLMPRNILKEKNQLKIVHCGYLKKPRDPELFLRALSIVKAYDKYSDLDFIFYLVGSYDDTVSDLIKDLGLSRNIVLIGSLNYKESMEFIAKCDLALIIEAQCEEGIYLPTKVVDSLQSSLPILCISPNPGVLKDIISNYKVGYYADNTSIDEITNILDKVFADYKAGSLPKISKSVIPYVFEDSIVKQYLSIL